MCFSRNGVAIRALLAGDCSAQGGDHSAADMALASHLAFWCAGDAARMDRIFRASGLMRDKWDSRRGGTTYGAQTIERAISGATEFYRPRAARRDGSSRPHTNNKNVCSIPTRREQRGVPDGDGGPEQATEGAPSVEGLARGRARQALGGGCRRGAALHRDGDGALDRLRPGGRGHGRRPRARARGRGRRRARAGARPRRPSQPVAHHRRAGPARGERVEHQRQGHRALPDRLRAPVRGLAPPRAQRGPPGLGGRAALLVHALRRGRAGCASTLARRGGEGAAVHGTGGGRSLRGWRAWCPRGRRRLRSAA